MTLLLAIGLCAGALTTITGVAGGMVALSLLCVLMPPAEALAISAAGFAIGNGHRLVLFASKVDRRVAAWFGLGLGIGAISGAAYVRYVPPQALRLALVAIAAASLSRVLWRRRYPATASSAARFSTRARTLFVGGIAAGVIGAGTGGAGVLVAPLLLAAGLRREPYVATVAACAIILNSARVVGYGLSGMYSADMLPQIGALAVALVCGNLAGRWMRGRLSERVIDHLEIAAPALAIALVLAGLS